jgi:uncharacterized membrane protein YhhN
VGAGGMEDILKRFWENLAGRLSGPLNFRLVIQPTVAGILAIRAGLRDAREGRPAFLWAAITNSAYRPELLRHGWRDVGKVFLIAAILDSIYQLIVHRGVFLLELVVVATVLAIVPYVLIRGPVSHIATALCQRRDQLELRKTVLEGRKQLKGDGRDKQ